MCRSNMVPTQEKAFVGIRKNRSGERSARWGGEEFAHQAILDTSDVAMVVFFFRAEIIS